VLVALLGQVVHGGAVGDVDVLDHADLGQEVERPVHSCPVQPRVELLDRGCDVGGREVGVVIRIEEHTQHRGSCAGDALAALPERRDDAIEAVGLHAREARRAP
jgi:hypothetical protein